MDFWDVLREMLIISRDFHWESGETFIAVSVMMLFVNSIVCCGILNGKLSHEI